MSEQINWLQDVQKGHWAPLAAALRKGLPVPAGYVVDRTVYEKPIRRAYEEMKMREFTHFVAVRGPSHAVIEVIGTDPLIHTLRRFWAETPDAEILIQRMVNSDWCGKASWDGGNLRVLASEGLSRLDPDVYAEARVMLHQRPRRVFRGVDGLTRTMTVRDQRQGLSAERLAEIGNLAKQAGGNITWAFDDRRLWLLSVA